MALAVLPYIYYKLFISWRAGLPQAVIKDGRIEIESHSAETGPYPSAFLPVYKCLNAYVHFLRDSIDLKYPFWTSVHLLSLLCISIFANYIGDLGFFWIIVAVWQVRVNLKANDG